MQLPSPLPHSLGAQIVPSPGAQSTYDANPEFNEYLNASIQVLDNGLILVGEVLFQASEILYRMDPIAYENALVEYQGLQTERFKQTILQQFPTPLAHRFDEVENGWSNYRHRLSLLKDFWETIITVLYAVVLGEARCTGVALKSVVMRDAKQASRPLKFEDLMSDQLAAKLGVIAGILEFESQQNLATKSLDLIPLETITRIRSLNQARNDFAHAETKSEEQAEQLFNSYYTDALEVCRLVTGLANSILMRFAGGKDVRNPRFEYFVGYAMNRHYRNVPLTASQVSACLPYLNDTNVVVMIEGQIFSTSPFLHFVSSNDGHVTKLCGFKRKLPGAKYDFSVFGESKTQAIPASTFQRDIDALRSLLDLPASRGNDL